MTSSKSGREPSLGGDKKRHAHTEARLAGDRAVLHRVEKLDDPDPIVRERAALALGEMGDARAFSVLVELVRGGQNPVAQRARKALENFTLPEYFEPLLDVFWEIESNLSLSTIIVACDRERAFEAFSAGLSDPSAGKRRFALHALRNFDDRDLAPTLIDMLGDADPRVRRAALDGLGDRLDPRSVPALIAQLDDPDDYMAGVAAQWLGEIGDRRAVPALIALALSDHTARINGAWALRELKDPEAATALLNTALDRAESDTRRNRAVEALGGVRDRAAVPPLLTLYDDPAETLLRRIKILDTIGQIGGEIAEERLIQLLAGEDPEVRVYALNGLFNIRSERSARVILSLVDDPDPDIRIHLQMYFTQVLRSNLKPDKAWPIGPFAEALHSENPTLRMYAASELWRIMSAESTAALAGALADPDPVVRAEVVKGLGHHKSTESVEALIVMLKTDEAQRVRIAAMDALNDISDQRAVAPLIEAMDDPDAAIRSQAIRTLGAMGAVDAVPGMIRRLADTEPVMPSGRRRVCDVAASTLENIRTPEAAAALAEWRQRQPQSS